MLPLIQITGWVSTWKIGLTSVLLLQFPLTFKVLVTTIDAPWEGVGDVESARYEAALLPPCPTISFLRYSD